MNRTLPPNMISEFLAAIEPFNEGIRRQAFSYACRKVGDRWELLSGKLELDARSNPAECSSIETPNIIVGTIDLTTLDMSVAQLIEALGGSGVPMPFGALTFVKTDEPRLATYEKQDAQSGQRSDICNIWGGRSEFSPGAELDWEFRTAAEPYDGFAEALGSHGLSTGYPQGLLAITARQILLIADQSTIDGTRAKLHLLLSGTASRDDVSVAYRVISAGSNGPSVVARGQFSKEAIIWKLIDDWWQAEISLDVPNGAIVQCFASYKKVGQHRYFVAGPHSIQNSARLAYEVFDPALANLRQYLSGKGKDRGKDFETGVANLFALLGFSVTQLSASRSKEAPDLLIRVPFTGDVALVECTTDTLKGDNKLNKLIARTVALRERFASGGLGHLRVLPVMASCLPKAQLEADLSDARRLGIAVADQEMLMRSIDSTLFLSDPAKIFEDAVRTVEEGKAVSSTITAAPIASRGQAGVD